MPYSKRLYDFQWVHTYDAGIDGRSIGRITILDAKSFVRVSEASAAQILARGDVEVRGKRVPVKPARGPEGGGGAPGPRHKSGGPKHKKGRGRPPRGPRGGDDRSPHEG
ncbi:MAG: DbpA RNA binding domain-containing protein [Myxococcota bacterium]